VVACHSGDKVCEMKDCKFIGNRFHDGSGLWCDINVNNTLMAENVFENCMGGVYFEISRWCVVVNNVFRNCGRGMMSYSSDVLIANNIFDGCSEGVLIMGYPRGCSYNEGCYDKTAPSVTSSLMAVRNNLVLNNIIINSCGSYIASTKEDAYNLGNFSDHNVFVWTYDRSHHLTNHIKFMAGWDDYYARLQFWRMERHYDENSIIVDANLYRLIKNGASWLNADEIEQDVDFYDRLNGDYRLHATSPVKGKGITIPMVLNSTYIPPKDNELISRAWAQTGIDTPAAKGRPVLTDIWGTKHYRIEPLPQVHRLVDLDEQTPADPGINLAWRATGKYPEFRHEGPPETVSDDTWVVSPTNRLKNGNFSEGLYMQMNSVDPKAKALAGGWEAVTGKTAVANGAAVAQLAVASPAAPAVSAQKYKAILPNTEYLLWGEMKVDGLKDGYTTTGRFYLAAGKELTPIKSIEVKSVGQRKRHWITLTIDYRSGADAKADPFVGKDLYIVFSGAADGAKTDEVVGSVQWDNFQLLTGEPATPPPAVN
jgi:hypothetical protein